MAQTFYVNSFNYFQITTIVVAPLTANASSVTNWDDKNVVIAQVTNNCLDNNVVQMSNKKLHHIRDV
jgi:hypothetical protein